MSYDETAELPVGSQVVPRDGQQQQDSGPGRGRLLSSSSTTRTSRGKDDSPTRIPIGDRGQTPDPTRRDGTTANA
eukprot:8507357-Pyramimonas_sp.AAC.1